MTHEEKVESLATTLYATWWSTHAVFDEDRPQMPELTTIDFVSRWKNPAAHINRKRFREQARLLLGIYSIPNNLMEIK